MAEGEAPNPLKAAAAKAKKVDGAAPRERPKAVKLKMGVVILDLKVGGGNEVGKGSKVSVSYVGRFNTNTGKVFDKSGRAAFKFKVGAGDVIKGWDIGVPGMRVGGKRRITVPSKAGYGKHPCGKIPGNSTLCFDVELLGDPKVRMGGEEYGF